MHTSNTSLPEVVRLSSPAQLVWGVWRVWQVWQMSHQPVVRLQMLCRHAGFQAASSRDASVQLQCRLGQRGGAAAVAAPSLAAPPGLYDGPPYLPNTPGGAGRALATSREPAIGRVPATSRALTAYYQWQVGCCHPSPGS